MAYNKNRLQLTHVLQHLYRRLGGTIIPVTDGSNTIAVDTKLAEALADGNVDDFLNGGTIIVVEDAGGSGAAPEGEFSFITDYDSVTTTITFNPAVSANITAGDKILYYGPDFPLYDMIEVVNDALKYLEEIAVPDTSLTSAADKTEYDLPVAAFGRQLLDVEIQTRLGDADNNGFEPVEYWRIVPPSTPGGTPKLVLPQPPAGYTIRVTYLGIHPRVTTFDADISPFLHPDLVNTVVFAHALQWKNDSNAIQGAPDNALLGLEQKVWSQVDRARILHKTTVPPRRIQGMPHWTPTNVGRMNITPPYNWYG